MASATALVLIMGCASPGPGIVDVAGVYQGQLDLDGILITGTLEMTQEGPEVIVMFNSPSIGITASGEGVVNDAQVLLRLDYDFQCPGEARLEGTFAVENGLYSGTATASDCTGDAAGSFSFTRR